MVSKHEYSIFDAILRKLISKSVPFDFLLSFSSDIIEAASDTDVTLRAQIRGQTNNEDYGFTRDLFAL